MVFFVVELLLYFWGFLDVVVDFEGQLLGNCVLVGKFFENFELLASVLVLKSDVVEDGSHAVDVVGHDDAAEGLDEDEADGFLVVGCWEVAESNSQHDVGGPVDRPDVLLGPGGVAKAVFDEPAVVGAETGHGSKDDADDVGVAEVD